MKCWQRTILYDEADGAVLVREEREALTMDFDADTRILPVGGYGLPQPLTYGRYSQCVLCPGVRLALCPHGKHQD
jgi:hypothetical protein